jgi:hypothetical protein
VTDADLGLLGPECGALPTTLSRLRGVSAGAKLFDSPLSRDRNGSSLSLVHSLTARLQQIQRQPVFDRLIWLGKSTDRVDSFSQLGGLRSYARRLLRRATDSWRGPCIWSCRATR